MKTLTRPARPEDAPSIAAIYNQGIQGRQATFRTQAATSDEILGWLEQATVRSTRHPLIVAELEGEVLGWTRASEYRNSPHYAGIAEYSIYIAHHAHGQGVGMQLLEALIEASTEAGLWKLVSRIFPENHASLALCHKTGFRQVGLYHKHAQLDGVWRDVVIVERLIERNGPK